MNYQNHRVSSIQNRVSSYLRAYKALYICRESSTNQPILCKTNPILSAVGGLQMNLSILSKMAYKNFIPLAGQKNKPNSNPIKPKTNPISKMPKMNVNIYYITVYSDKSYLPRVQNKPNQTQNKANFKACPERSRMGQFKCLESYTRSTPALISRRTRDQLFPSVQPHALAVAAFIAVPSPEPASDLSLRPFKKPANR